MPDIHQLPTAVVNKIAAGEVIERPASVVKELLENSIDAGARRIEVSLAGGGSELIRVADDGCGIAAEQLVLAVASHATSKINSAEDLFRVQTLGFRGEALASIAEISRLRLRSRAAQAQAGAELEVHGGVLQQPAPCGCPVGTTIEVQHLFFNTPVRRKFMRGVQTELGHCSEAFTRIALAHPLVHFTLKHNERIVYDVPPVENWRERIIGFFGAELGQGLLWVEAGDDNARVAGYVADPNFSRGNNRMQYLFLNGRHIRDRSLQHALGEAYRGLLMTGRFPIAFLRLDLPAETIDVNVHPTKLEVRFQDSGRIYSQVLGAVRNKFLASDLTAKVQSPPGGFEQPEPDDAHDAQKFEEHRQSLIRWARGDTAGAADGSSAFRTLAPHSPAPSWTSPAPSAGARAENTPYQDAVRASHIRRDCEHDVSAGGVARHAAGIQIQNRYLVAESGDGLVIIDQHALHERVLYEQLRPKVLAGQVEIQRLLVPETVTLAPTEAAAVLQSRDLLRQLGLEVEEFGGDTVLISGYPAILAHLEPAEILRQIVELLMTGEKAPQRRDLLDSMLHMVSCKAAVKAGDRLSAEEVSALLQQRHLCQDAHHCPHGRPTALVFTRDELDKRFKRI